MKTAAYLISWLTTQFALAGICTITYNFLLKNELLFEISFLNWIGIVIISSCIIPSGRIIKPGENSLDKTPDILKNRFKSDNLESSSFNTIFNKSKDKNGR
jgi:hypothetical protein